MKKTLFASLLLACSALFAQPASNKTLSPEDLRGIQPWEKAMEQDQQKVNLINHSRTWSGKTDTLPFNAALAPFYHGVASGDPLTDRVIIWTRVTPISDGEVIVRWDMATDPEMNQVVQTGTFSTNADRDYTVKVDVQQLQTATTYYYRFEALGNQSITGRTRTAASGEVEQLRFGVVSCSHYQQGYFNAYGRLADRPDLQAIIHLGDYIYEYGVGDDFADGTRLHEPDYEIISIEDYRTRHSLYKLDPDLRRAHQQNPFITVWDDHEVANNAWANGADNHTPGTEGDYAVRKQNAIQAYFEWMPIRDPEAGQPKRVYRTFKYGNLVDLIMLDTRHEGRDQQAASSTDPIINDPNRTMLGTAQRQWFEQQLIASDAKWTVIGNQVIFSPINTGGIIGNTDMWDGYTAERTRLFHVIDSLQLKNTVVITGDIHLGIGADMTDDPQGNYNPQTGEGALGVEFVATSVTSANDEAIPLPLPAEQIETLALTLNPHAKYLNIVDHGYLILDLNEERVQGDWYVIDTKLEPSTGESFNKGLFSLDQMHHLQDTATPAPTQANAPELAPEAPVGITDNAPQSNLLLIAAYPNPASEHIDLHYALSKKQVLRISLYDVSGKMVQQLFEGNQEPGIYTLRCAVSHLPEGTYFCRFAFDNGVETVKQVAVTR